MRKAFLRSVAQAVIGSLLFAQLAVAAYACPTLPSAGAQMSMQGSTDADSSKASMDGANKSGSNCDDMALGAMDPQNANLCAEHCKFGQQSDQTSILKAPAAPLMALYFAPLSPTPTAAGLRSVAAPPATALLATSPPHTILHCCFRI